MPFSRFPAFALCLAIGLPQLAFAAGLEPPPKLRVYHAMQYDPQFPEPPTTFRFTEDVLPLWLKTLEENQQRKPPEAELQRLIASAVARAHQKGLEGTEQAIEPLAKLLQNPDTTILVRRYVARALVVLGARGQADLLHQQTEFNDRRLDEIIAPALGRWKHVAAEKVWLDRLRPKTSTTSRGQVRAIRALALFESQNALPLLRAQTVDRRAPATVRMEAAEALGKLQKSDLLETARKLAESPRSNLLDRLAAVRMLSGHQDDSSRTFLQKMARDPQDAVASAAWKRLLEIDPELLRPLLDFGVAHRDSEVRRSAIAALTQLADADAAPRLRSLLNDPHPQLRHLAAHGLLHTAETKPQLRTTILDQLQIALNSKDWRTLEQAALLSAALDHKPALPRLLELTQHSQAETFVAAGWALQQIALPDNAAKILLLLQTARIQRSSTPGFQLQAHLIQALGRLRYKPADATLRKYVPKGSSDETPRAAAVWALGRIHTGNPPEQLVSQMHARFLDESDNDPESELVKDFVVVGLGHMKSQQSLDMLQTAYAVETTNSVRGYLCGWAIQQMTGEPIRPQTVKQLPQARWFLEEVR